MSGKSFKTTDVLPRRESVAAAKWWADLLRTFRQQVATVTYVNESDVTRELHKEVLAILTPKKIKQLEELLIEAIDKELNTRLSGCCIGISLGPDALLAVVFKKLKLGHLIELAAFKTLTYTDIRPGKVIACFGTQYAPGQKKELPLN